MHVVAAVEFLHRSILVDFWIFLVSEQGMRAVSIRLYFSSFFSEGYLESAKYPPDTNCISYSRHEIVWKLTYLGVKMTPLIQKHKIVMKATYLSVTNLHFSFKGIKS